MADFNWDALPNAPSQSSSNVPNSQSGFDWNSLQNANPDDINAAIHGTPLEQAKTAVEQGLSGLTLGGSKVAETKILGVKPEDIAARELANPVTSTASNILGTGALLYGTAGLGELGEGATFATRAARAGIEGATIGAVNAANDDWSQNKPLDAEKIAASAGINALFGIGGASILEALGKTGKGLDFFDNLMSGRAGGIELATPLEDQNWSQRLRSAYKFASQQENPDAFIRKLSDNLNELYGQASKASDEMYNTSGRIKISAALGEGPEALAATQAKAVQSINKVGELIAPAMENGEQVIALSPSMNRIMQKNIQEMIDKIADATRPYDVHQALRTFATNVGQEIKFNKLPSQFAESARNDQAILHSINNVVREDLKNPAIWGNAGSVYENMSNLYHQHLVNEENFESSFMKSLAGPTGKREFVVDPAKVKTYFNNAGDPGQIIRDQNLALYLDSATKMAQEARNYETFQHTVRDVADQLETVKAKIGNTTQVAATLKKIKKGAREHDAGVNDLFILEGLSHFVPGAAPLLLAVRRWAGETGMYKFGEDLHGVVEASKKLVKHTEKVSHKIDAGAKAIFYSHKKD